MSGSLHVSVLQPGPTQSLILSVYHHTVSVLMSLWPAENIYSVAQTTEDCRDKPAAVCLTGSINSTTGAQMGNLQCAPHGIHSDGVTRGGNTADWQLALFLLLYFTACNHCCFLCLCSGNYMLSSGKQSNHRNILLSLSHEQRQHNKLSHSFQCRA